MDIKLKKSSEKTTIILESSNREFSFKELPGDAISSNEKMSFNDLLKALYLAGKNDDAVFVTVENE